MGKHSDIAQTFNEMKSHRKNQRKKHGVNCPKCSYLYPNRNPSKLMPGQKCRWCGHVDERKEHGKLD